MVKVICAAGMSLNVRNLRVVEFDFTNPHASAFSHDFYGSSVCADTSLCLFHGLGTLGIS